MGTRIGTSATSGALRSQLLKLIAIGIAVMLLACAPARARASTAVAQGVDARTLFLAESFRPTAVRAALSGPVVPEQLVAQPGEEEGMQLAIKVPQATRLEAWVTGDPALARWAQILRIGWVDVSEPSSGLGGRTGLFADPLPPQSGASGVFDAGKLDARAGQWTGFVLVVSVPTSTAAGRYAGQLHVRDQHGVELVRQDVALTVVGTRTAQGVADPAIAPHDPRNFKVLFNFNPAWYRAIAPSTSAQQQYEQAYNTMWMLARHRAAPTNWYRAYPSADGTYSCSAANGYVKVYDQMPWWADGKPGAVPVALVPSYAVQRCSAGFNIRDDRGSANKYDDTIGDAGKSAWFIYRLGSFWASSGLRDHRTYFLNPFDEPNAAQNRGVVPQVNTMVHAYAPGVRVLATTWPMQRGTQQSDNSNLRDGGTDDLDGWVAPYFRAWGFHTKRGARSRSREVVDRLHAVQARGGESWTYDLPLGTKRVPQMAIDGPASDARFMFWPLGREGFQGWYTATSNRWVNARTPSKARNPWDDPLSWVGSQHARGGGGATTAGVVSNGWGSLFYPGYRPAMGLTDPLAQPVSSLRLQRLRDGVEDANLMRQYRDRFGQAALNKRTASVVGPMRDVPGLKTGETFPSYRLGGLALRMEAARRQMLAELAG
jgi:hypothetical protein